MRAKTYQGCSRVGKGSAEVAEAELDGVVAGLGSSKVRLLLVSLRQLW